MLYCAVCQGLCLFRFSRGALCHLVVVLELGYFALRQKLAELIVCVAVKLGGVDSFAGIAVCALRNKLCCRFGHGVVGLFLRSAFGGGVFVFGFCEVLYRAFAEVKRVVLLRVGLCCLSFALFGGLADPCHFRAAERCVLLSRARVNGDVHFVCSFAA